MVAIESAYWGDEKQTQNITKRILELVSGGKLNVTANEKLIPPLETPMSATIKLSAGEEKQITQDAEAQCGPADQECVEFNKNRLRQSKLRDKEMSTQSTASVIKGRRLTLILNRDGKRVKVHVPDGNKYSLEGIVGEITQTGDIKLPDKDSLRRRVVTYISTIIGVTIYVLGILIPYAVLRVDGLPAWAAVIGFTSIFIPYSGYILLIIYLVGKKIRS
jgi:hypothetical protein